MNQPKQKFKPNFKSVFIVDSVKGERLHLAKLLKQEKLFMMTFANITDCFKNNTPIKPNLIVYVLRKGKNELIHLQNIKKHFKHIHFILLLTSEVSEANLDKLKESGFTSVKKAINQDMVKELIYTTMPECQITETEDLSRSNEINS